MNLSRIACSIYSAFDKKVIAKATELNLPLIGGTAIEILGKHSGIKGYRTRSDNDLDFVAWEGNPNTEKMIKWCKKHTDPDKVKVDIFQEDKSVPLGKFMDVVNGVLVMKPVFQIWRKLQRFSKTDKVDILYLLNLVTEEELEQGLEELGLTEKEINSLNELIIEFNEDSAY